MATSYTTTIKNLKPQGWSRQTVADGQSLNNSFLEPTHQKDLKLAEGLDATNDRIDSVNTQMTTLGQRVSNAESTVANIGEDVQAYDQEIAQLNSNLQIVSAAEGDLATSLGTVTEKLNEHKNLVTVDSTTIAGDGSSSNPYTVIGGGGGGVSKVYVPNVDGGNLSYTLSAASAAESQIGPWDIKGPQGEPGIGLSADSEDSLEARHTRVRIWEKGAETYDTQFDLPWGQNGYDPEITLNTIPASTDPDAEHKNGGTKVTIVYGYNGSQTATYSAWNGNNGSMAGAPDIEGDDGVSASFNGSKYFVGFSGGVYVSSLSAGSANNAGYSELAGSATYAEKFKVDNTDYTFSNLYSEVDTLSNASGRWNAHSALSATKLDKSIWDSNSGKFLQTVSTNTTAFSGDGTSQSPLDLKINNPNSNKKYGYQPGTGWTEISEGGSVTDYDIVGNNGISAEKDTTNNQYIVGLSGKYVNTSGDTMTGPLVVSASNHNIVGLGKGAFQFGQTRYDDDNNAIGTNWMGVGSNGCGFLKYAAGGASASEEGTNGKVQINYSVDNGNGKITVDASYNGTTSQTQVINATTASVGTMVASAIDSNNVSGPNYMLAKNADGQFIIGAAVYNCQTNLPQTLTPNTYYFVY